ncbi:A/G-specific adenine glycosylase [Thiosulfativibrio zosterae]|uniref:Adenine DNA glycosylase n=1 Tax=Thiosulfativibrio zosterae TaxID=2675053 RepID=A0A6F8PJW1_9GAMM|nr:A/G-specific adenine glycosylase [Thiosulfativibrio zosterae]BBP42385.1 A/G-specific adenine glycosylase [Thiosulfativibrio zosterae]
MSEHFSKDLLAWYDQFGRHDLPWQTDMTPYRVWVSEIMLQQTQVQTVIPYYLKFMASFPSVLDLANASQEAVLAHWSGLGYYARGRNLHRTAQIIRDEYGGQFPADFDTVVSLPGIGRSTAGAILALAFKQRYAILDGNVKRVLCRYDAIDSWSGLPKTHEALWQRADSLTPLERFDDYTQAIMDLGATLCKRSRPMCERCPVAAGCVALKENRVKFFPVSKPKAEKPTRETLMLVCRNAQGQIALQQRPQTGIWGGLWSLPEFNDEESLRNALANTYCEADLVEWPKFKHTFTHYHLWITPYYWCLSDSLDGLSQSNWVWFDLSQAFALGLPAPVRKILENGDYYV